MKNLKTAACIAIALLIPLVAGAYTVSGPGFQNVNGAAVRLAGVNVPYMMFLTQPQIDSAMKALNGSGINLARIYASFSGNRAYAFQTGLGKYNESQFAKLDYVISQAEKNGINLIITLMDNNPTYGGKEAYRAWTGGANDDVFFKDKISREFFKKYIMQFLDRKNTVTGKLYKNDSTIMAWDLCADAENLSDEDGAVMYGWAGEIAPFVKANAPKHMVMMGMKKINTAADAVNDYDIFMNPSIDAVFYSVQVNQAMPAAAANRLVEKWNRAFLENVNKPVMLLFSDKSVGNESNVKQAADSFFAAGGSAIIFNYAGFETYRTYPGAYDFSLPPVRKEFRAAADSAAAVTKPVPSLAVEDLKVRTAPEGAKITFKAPGRSQAEVIYGDKLPLKMSSGPAQESGGNITVTLDGLSPEKDYRFMVKLKSGSAAGISKAYSFKTLALTRFTAIPFARSGNFIKAKGTNFYDGDRIYRYLGTSNYYMRNSDKTIIDYIFREAARAGFKVIRVGSNGEAESFKTVDKGNQERFFRIGPDYFNEKAYKQLDYVLDAAARNKMRVILHFTDNWEYYGGVKMYVKWAGLDDKNAFWTNPKAKEYYKQTIEKIVNRKNTVNGMIYKDDPTIFAYDLCNEPRNEADLTGKTLTDWVTEMSAYCKSLDPNHMVTTGMEGFFLKDDGTHYSGADFVMCQKPETIDFATYHIYPTYEHNSFSLSTTEWLLKKWVSAAHGELKKPVVMEEYGIASNREAYPKAKWIDAMTKAFFDAGGNGANYWFFIDPSYTYGDGFEVNPTQTEYMNVFIKYANMINKPGY